MINEHERHFDQHLANNTIVLTRRHMELFLNMRVMLGISFVCLFSAVYPKTRIDTHTRIQTRLLSSSIASSTPTLFVLTH